VHHMQEIVPAVIILAGVAYAIVGKVLKSR
jgi:hypothetical protein